MRILLTAIVMTLSTIAPTAQDALTAVPGSYAKQFENEWVRVVRVRYAPHAKLPAHTHTALPSAYVYLNDGGPVRFGHIGTPYGAATRPATKAGSFRVYRGLEEIHEVENMSDLPSEFLRIEFKTDPRDVSTLKGRFFSATAAEGANLEKRQFENEQVRITRLIIATGRSMRLTTDATVPALLIALQAGQLRESDGTALAIGVGQERWLAAGSVVAFENAGREPHEFLRFDFKTAPARTAR